MVTIDWDDSLTAAPKIRDKDGVRDVYTSRDGDGFRVTVVRSDPAGNTFAPQKGEIRERKRLRGNGYTTNKSQGQSKAKRKMSKESRKKNRGIDS